MSMQHKTTELDTLQESAESAAQSVRDIKAQIRAVEREERGRIRDKDGIRKRVEKAATAYLIRQQRDQLAQDTLLEYACDLANGMAPGAARTIMNESLREVREREIDTTVPDVEGLVDDICANIKTG